MLGSFPLGSAPLAALGRATGAAGLVTVRAFSTLGYGSGHVNSTFTKPAGLAAGDRCLIIMFAGQGGSAPTVTAPTGFITPAGNPNSPRSDGSFVGGFYVFYRDCDGSEGASFATTHSAASTEGICLALTGADLALPPIIGAGNNDGGVSDGQLASAHGITTGTGGAMVFDNVFAWSSASGATSTGFATVYNAGGVLGVLNRTYTTPGATGNTTTPLPSNAGPTDHWGNFLLGIEAATVSGNNAALATTEAADTAAFAVTPKVTAALATTEAADTAAFAVTPKVTAALATTEAQDTAAFSATPNTNAQLAVTEAADTAAFAVTPKVTAALATTEATDTAAFTANAQGPAVTAVLATTEAADTAQMSANNVGALGFVLTMGALEVRASVLEIAAIASVAATT